MPMRTLLVPVETDHMLDATLGTALVVARRFGSHIEGMHVHPIAGSSPTGWGGPPIGSEMGLADILERQNQERAKHVQRLFEAFFRDRLVVGGESEGSDGEATVSWRQETASGLAAYGERGRVRDLIVIPRPDGEGGSIHGGLIQPLLFDSGRPLLIAPPVAPGSVGECVVIAWNGSMEAARTLALAMPFVVSTDRLVLLTVEASAVPGPSGEDVAENLTRHGVEVETMSVRGKPRLIGEAILETASGLGADLLIRGAYTQGRMRQIMFGSSTNHILRNTKVPVFMAA